MSDKIDRSGEPDSLKSVKAFTNFEDFEVVTINSFSDVGLTYIVPCLDKLDKRDMLGGKFFEIHPANFWLLQNFNGSHGILSGVEFNGWSYDSPILIREDQIVARSKPSPLMRKNLEGCLKGGEITVSGKNGDPETKKKDGVFLTFDKHREREKSGNTVLPKKSQIQV